MFSFSQQPTNQPTPRDSITFQKVPITDKSGQGTGERAGERHNPRLRLSYLPTHPTPYFLV